MTEGYRPKPQIAEKEPVTESKEGLPPVPELYVALKQYQTLNLPIKFLHGTGEATPENIRSMAQPYKEYFSQVSKYFQEQQLEDAAPSAHKPFLSSNISEFRGTVAVLFAKMIANKFGIAYSSEVAFANVGSSSFERQADEYKYVARESAGNGRARFQISRRQENGRYVSEGVSERSTNGWYETRVRDLFLEVMDEF